MLTFKNIDVKKFHNEGYIKIPALVEDEIDKLKKEIAKITTEYTIKNISYHVTLLSKDKEYQNYIQLLLYPYFEKICEKYFSKHRILLCNLILKESGQGEVPLHQNWTFVDEQKYRSYTLWIPLIDVNTNNGMLEFVAGSHQIFSDVLRGHNTPYFFLEQTQKLNNLAIPMPLLAGEALLFDDSILHSSATNLSTNTRIAIQAIIVPDEAPLCHYHYRKEWFRNSLYKYDMCREDYFNMDFTAKYPIKKITYKKRKITESEWQFLYDIHKNLLTL